MAVRSQTATAIPRYYGFGTALTFYTWTSDQSSQYGSKPTPSTVRDSTYVLDGVLDNETELPIAEHTTDTAGFPQRCANCLKTADLAKCSAKAFSHLYPFTRHLHFRTVEDRSKSGVGCQRFSILP